MEQRFYRGSSLTPQGLADYLAQSYTNSDHYMAQVSAPGDNMMVQIGRRGHWDGNRAAFTIGISKIPEGISVTMGQQRWLDSGSMGMMIGAISFAAVGILITPWAFFGLIGPLSAIAYRLTASRAIMEAIDTYCLTNGGQLTDSKPYTAIYCPHCHGMNAVDATFCTLCGNPFVTPALPPQSVPDAPIPTRTAQPALVTATQPTTKVCANCERVNSTEASFCNGCGQKI